MAWRVLYHPEVHEDLEALGQAEVRRILKVISDRIQNGEPDKLGKALRGALTGCRRIRTATHPHRLWDKPGTHRSAYLGGQDAARASCL